MEPVAFKMPSWRSVVRNGLPHVIEGRIVPLALFTVSLQTVGTGGALLVALGWSYAAVIRRLIRGKRVPGILLIGVLTLTARTLISLATGSLLVYFLQPVVATLLLGAGFGCSVPLGLPLCERLFRDFCPLPPELTDRPEVKRYFARISYLWAGVQVANAALTLSFIMGASPTSHLVLRAALCALMTGAALLASGLWFRRLVRRQGLLVAGALVAARPAITIP